MEIVFQEEYWLWVTVEFLQFVKHLIATQIFFLLV